MESDRLIHGKREQQRPTVRQTLVATIVLSILAILLIVIGMGLKLAYWPSLYFPDQNTGLAALGLILLAIGVPVGITAACLINVVVRVRTHIAYTEARKREMETRVSDVYEPEKRLDG
ncbi:unnamed protein product [Dicrocoelium dendriticum]|nr:unnamed protein product [Dicrocoelium dendriticum]